MSHLLQNGLNWVRERKKASHKIVVQPPPLPSKLQSCYNKFLFFYFLFLINNKFLYICNLNPNKIWLCLVWLENLSHFLKRKEGKPLSFWPLHLTMKLLIGKVLWSQIMLAWDHFSLLGFWCIVKIWYHIYIKCKHGFHAWMYNSARRPFGYFAIYIYGAWYSEAVLFCSMLANFVAKCRNEGSLWRGVLWRVVQRRENFSLY